MTCTFSSSNVMIHNYNFHYCFQILRCCLGGLQNIIVQDSKLLNKELNILLGTSRSYMLYGLKGVEFSLPKKLMPSVLSIPEPVTNVLREKKGGKVSAYDTILFGIFLFLDKLKVSNVR